MAILESLFERYRNNAQKKHLNPQVQEATPQVDKFGQDALQKNPNLRIFDNAKNNIADIIDRRSVVSQFKTNTEITTPENYFSSLFAGITALPIYTNKADRIRQYRAMSMYTECDFCLCELADDCIHDDEQGHFINLIIPDEKTHLTEDRRKVLQVQFDKFIDLFKFREDGFTFIKKFLVDGELTFENIINIKKPELGIIGIKYLPTEYYETIMNPQTGKNIGIIFDKEKMNQDIKNIVSNSCIGARSIFNNMITTAGNFSRDTKNVIPILYPQITYISSGETSPDGLICFPLIEKCKQAYHQLALMQDSAVILRVTRAPERLLFNISTGGQPVKVARPMIKEFMEQLKSKKVVSSNSLTGKSADEITAVYNPVSMLESYFFGKSNANDGTTVESVGSQADYEQIADIEFFLRRLFKQFKVPFSRYKTPENSMERDETISYEEYSMARMIIRIQRRFALGLKRSFITHLKLLGLWEKYGMKESDFNISFVTPILYDLYQQQKMIGAKMDAYKTVVDQEELSKTVAMKKILKMTDDDIEENFKQLIKEKQLVAVADYWADQINDDHKPMDYPSPIRLTGIEDITVDKETENSGNEGGQENGNEEQNEGPLDLDNNPPTEEGGENTEGGNGENQGGNEGGEEQNTEGSGEETPSFGI